MLVQSRFDFHETPILRDFSMSSERDRSPVIKLIAFGVLYLVAKVGMFSVNGGQRRKLQYFPIFAFSEVYVWPIREQSHFTV